MPAQSNVNQIRSYIKELQIQTGKHPDFIMVDYLDLVMPVSAKVSPNDLFVKDKYVSEELRNLAKEFNILMITASQLNRGAVEEIEFDHSHIAGGLSKINTADNVFGIFTSRAMRERGRYQLQLMKTRSSSGVGMKVDLEYDLETLRITDPGEEGQGDGNGATRNVNNVLNNIKSSSTLKQEDTPKTVAHVDSSKLKSMLAGLKSSTD
jgi:replicative DNA helicase